MQANPLLTPQEQLLRQQLSMLGREQQMWRKALRPLQIRRPHKQYLQRRIPRRPLQPMLRPLPTLAKQRLLLQTQLQAHRAYRELLTQAWRQVKWHPLPQLPQTPNP